MLEVCSASEVSERNDKVAMVSMVYLQSVASFN